MAGHNNDKTIMVGLSLAAALMLPVSEAYAQLQINCGQALQFASFAACGGGGAINVAPGGTPSVAGCGVLLGTPKQAICSAKSFATTGSIQVKVSTKTTNITGPGVMQLKNLNVAGGGPTKTWTSVSLTATPLLFGIGGQLNFSGGQTVGTYNGSIIMTVTFTP